MSVCELYMHKKCRKTVFVTILILSVVDVFMDFLFYAQLKGLEKGLVYGPVSAAVYYSVLGFAILGLLIFSTETLISALNTFKEKELDFWVDVLSAVGIWFADVPQIILNVYVAACREELVRNVQFVKGVVILMLACARFVVVIIRCCINREHFKSKILVFVGALITSMLACLVFVFSFYHTNDGQLVRTDNNRYFENVGVFVNQKYLLPGRGLSDSGWVKITDVSLLRKSKEDMNFRYDFLETSGDSWIMTVENTQKQNVLSKNCYNLSRSQDGDRLEESRTLCSNDSVSENITRIDFQFHFDKPKHGFFDNSKIFGDILFNVRSNTPARDVTPTDEQGEVTDAPVNPVRYFRYLAPGKIFQQTSLTNIKDVWKTGHSKCESTGNLYPTKDTTLKMDDGK